MRSISRYSILFFVLFLSASSYAQNSESAEMLRKEYILQGKTGGFEVCILRLTSINTGRVTNSIRIEGRDKIGVS